MKHAGSETLERLADLLEELRLLGLQERSLGVFYRKGRAWLHFHDDPSGLYADIRVKQAWQRFRVSDSKERARLLHFIQKNPP